MIYDLELKTEIKAQFSGQSVLDFLTDRFTYKTSEQWLNIINSGDITINNEKITCDYILKEGTTLNFIVHNYYEPDLDCNYHKVFENENIIVVNKPPNLPITSNHRFFKQNMTALLRDAEKLPEINPIHRIDRETSGLLIYLKKKFDKPVKLRKDPRLIMKEKYYLAIVRGQVKENNFVVNIPLKESNIPPIGYKVIEANQETGKEASTVFHKIDSTDKYTLLLAKLNSGRKHQIRAHCSISGFPIVGDKLYSFDGKYYLKRFNNEELDEKDYEILGSKHHLLHAYALNLELPNQESPVQIISNYFSDEFKKYLSLFNKNVLEKVKEAIRIK